MKEKGKMVYGNRKGNRRISEMLWNVMNVNPSLPTIIKVFYEIAYFHIQRMKNLIKKDDDFTIFYNVKK